MRLRAITNNNQPLHPVTLASIPTLNATEAYHKVSRKYQFLSTGEVTTALMAEGLLPYSMQLSATRIEEKRSYVKHSIRFRAANQPMSVGGFHPEIVVTNSHDTASSFQIELGIFRLVCSNGLVVSSGMFDSYRIRHVGSSIKDVLQAARKVLDYFPQVHDSIQRYRQVELTDSQRLNMAIMAMGLRWKPEHFPFPAERLLETRRVADDSNDLWSTYNVIQENLLQGQRPWRFPRGRMAVKGSRPVSSIDSGLSINRELWQLLEHTAVIGG